MSARSKLQEWMAKEGLSQSEVAQALGISQGQVSRLLGGTRAPDLLAAKLETVSAGAVRATDWLAAGPPSAARRRSRRRPTKARHGRSVAQPAA